LEFSLVVLPKTQSELDWEKHWRQKTPQWLQRAAEVALTDADFTSMRQQNVEHVNESLMRECRPTQCKVHAGRGCACLHEVLAGMPCVSFESPPPRKLSCEEFLRAMRKKPHLLQRQWRHWQVGRDIVTEEVATEAMAREPEAILPHLGDTMLPLWVGDLISACPGVYKLLPKCWQQHKFFLYPALEADEDLRDEFLETATKAEVNEWRWARAECLASQPRRRHVRKR